MVRNSDHSISATTTTTAMATAATITEVSMRQPCQVIATSPGRSTIQTAPNAIKVTNARNTMTRIIDLTKV